MSRHPARALFVCFAVFAAVPALADADGAWYCKANGNIPLAFVTISGNDYAFQRTNGADAPIDHPEHGDGWLSRQDGLIIVADGPVLSWEAVGQVEDGVLYWNNQYGTVAGCWPR